MTWSNGFGRLLVVVTLAAAAYAFAQPPATESGFVQVEDDVRLFYQRFGSGPPKVLVANRHEILGTIGPLLFRHDVVLYDPRGRGLSDRPDDLTRYTIDREIADAEALRQHLGVERIGYVGNSLWGNIALLYAARHPERVSLAVALGPLEVAAELFSEPDRVIARDTSHLDGMIAEKAAMEADGRAQSDPYAYCRIEKYLGTLESYVHESSMAYFVAANLCQYRNEHVDRILPVVFEGTLAAAGEWDWRDEMVRVEAPVLLLYGDHDWALEGIRAHADYIRDVGWLMVADAGHSVAMDRPDVVVPLLDAFFRGQWPEGLNR